MQRSEADPLRCRIQTPDGASLDTLQSPDAASAAALGSGRIRAPKVQWPSTRTQISSNRSRVGSPVAWLEDCRRETIPIQGTIAWIGECEKRASFQPQSRSLWDMDISFRPMTLSHQQAPHIFLCHLTVDIILFCITADELLSSFVPFTKSGQE